jgi:putative ABC transport system substrate-binding protein
MYFADVGAMCRKVAVYIDRIVKGASPADLPVEEPTKFNLIVNARAAKALGIKIPQELRLRADKVIE